MSIRIQNDHISGITSLPPSGTSKPNSSVGFQGQDNVELSATSESLQAALSSQTAARAARVRQLSALYSAGKYTVDSSQLSRALVSQAINYPMAQQ
jgi:anti-sigma28 factor (negative regulator of flagellin synthesis)